jgi:FKBP-type peptidyl-prolyl cis-trans isomerase 2
MSIETGSTVQCAYVLSLADGTHVDVATTEEPFQFVVGQQDVFPAFEQAFLGRSPGDSFGFDVKPEDGYGSRDPQLVQEFPKAAFGDEAELEIGEQYVAETEEGMPVSFRVESIEDDVIKADFNHPLAGKKLSFQVEVLGVQ